MRDRILETLDLGRKIASGTNGLRTPRWREPDSITFGETEQTELVNVWSMTIGGRHRSGRLADRARSS
jgi:hypothetical protein